MPLQNKIPARKLGMYTVHTSNRFKSIITQTLLLVKISPIWMGLHLYEVVSYFTGSTLILALSRLAFFSENYRPPLFPKIPHMSEILVQRHVGFPVHLTLGEKDV